MISFDSKEQIFYLETQNTTYAMCVFHNQVLVHLYWGKRINPTLKNDYCLKFKRRTLTGFDCGEFSTEDMPLEYSTYGNADTRLPSFGAVYSDGSRISKLIYKGYKIVKGKPSLEGLPATYCVDENEAETLIIQLFDSVKTVDVYLSYTVFDELDAITRSVKIVNNGERLLLNTALSATVDFYGMDESDILHLDGTWCRERHITRRRIVHGNQNIDSRSGASSAYHNPFIAICDKDATENHGDVYGFSLVYSGNFTAGVELNAYNCARAYIGINPFEFEFVLENGESLQTPEAVLTYSLEGLGGMSRIYHKLYRTRLCRGKYRDAERFVLINNWEATYFNFDEAKLVEIAKKASEIGVDTMVLDDGWFGARNTDKAGLGDWYENPDRLPNGLKSLADKVNSLGMRFGLWFEPEMVNPDSDLYRKHPDWVLHVESRESSLVRNQLTLDLSRKDVCDYIIEAVSAVLNKANIEYVKWDMNRYMTEAGSALLPPEKQGEVMHRYMLGLYYVLETITNRFPNVLFESCASGGGRFDPGMLYYMPQTWTSDDSDAVERLMIQYGTSIVYPYSAMGAHVSACPNHQVSRTTPFRMRCNVAMPGQFGFELDLNKCTEKELETARQAIIEYKELQHIFHKGDCYRLKSPFETNLSVIQFISEDKNTVVVCIDSKKAIPNAPNEYIRLEGLDDNAVYSLDGEIYGGDYLMNRGIVFINDVEYKSLRLILKKYR
ncbi:MAG: alpha-galactosidase [Clostridia bacterium]|nr:alpha-galactosidase [Clostridia bacterium]